MLRITTHENADSLTYQLEGKLAGLWVQELEKCWRTRENGGDSRAVRFDLTGLTFVDERGKELLRDVCGHGVELAASGCLMRAVVAEVANSSTK